MSWQDKFSDQSEKLKQLKVLQTLRQECGSILVFTAVAIPTLLALVGFGFDVGNLYMHKARLQNMADAAALAGARAYTDNLDKSEGGAIDNGDTRGNPSHANAVADEYIAKNRINIPNTIYHDFNSKKIRVSDDSNVLYPNKSFYRIGLYENVQLHFLPVISGIPKTQKVRAEAIAIALPGETTTTHGSGGNSSVTHASLFDNLFTYSTSLFTENIISGNGTDIVASFKGTIAYTHYNGLSDEGTPDSGQFYNANNPSDNNDERGQNHLYTNQGTVSNNNINDPLINTYVDTKAYLDAFRSKLNEPHVDIKGQDFYLTGDGVINSECNLTYKLNNSTELYRKDGDIFYLLDSEGKDATFEENGKTYKILYHKFNTESNKYVLCGKSDADTDYYFLNVNGKISNCYIAVNTTSWGGTEKIPKINLNGNEKYLGLTGDSKFIWGENQYYQDPGNVLTAANFKDGINLQVPVESSSFIKQNSSSTETKSNVYHANRDLFDQDAQTVTIWLDQVLGGYKDTSDMNTPIYILVDENIPQLKVQAHNSTTNVDYGRPVIIVYYGTGQLKFDVSSDGRKNTFRGTIYAPLTDIETTNFTGTFKGNIVAKKINIASGQGGTWIQENFLEDHDGYTDNAIKAITEQTEQKIAEANEALTDDLKTKIADALGIEKSNLGDMNWYQSQKYAQKKALYVAWKNLYDLYKDNEVLRNILWPFNEFFDIGEEIEQTVTTPDNIRLINPRIEKNPFTIYDVQWKML